MVATRKQHNDWNFEILGGDAEYYFISLDDSHRANLESAEWISLHAVGTSIVNHKVRLELTES